MPTPDLSDYVDLTFYDLDPQDVFEAALLDLQSKLPEWEPREGNVEVMLMEAMALQVAEVILAVNRVPPAIIMALLRLYGVDPDPGEQASASLLFTVSDTFGHTIPEGTSATLELAGGLEPLVFSTDEDLVIPEGEFTGVVLATADRYTAEGTGIGIATRLSLLDSVAFVDYVELATAVAGGRESEDDDGWIERGVQRFARLSETLVLPKHFQIAAVVDNPGVVRANVIDNWDGVSAATQGADAGHVTVAVYGDGAPVSAPDKAALLTSLEEQAAANLAIHVIDANVTSIDLTATLVRKVDASEAEAIAAATEVIVAYLSTGQWAWQDVVRRNKIVATLGAAYGVAYVGTLTAPAADVALTGAPGTNLVDVGTLTLTVGGVEGS